MIAHPVVQLIFKLLLAWTCLSLVRRIFGLMGVAILALIIAVFAYLSWAIQYRRESLFRSYQNPLLKPIIDVTARLNRCQPPVEGVKKPATTLRCKLRSNSDFVELMEHLSKNVVGHRRTACELVLHLQNELLLREHHSANRFSRPLGSYLLIGNRGIGKRRIAELIGHATYGASRLAKINLANPTYGETAQGLLGDQTQPGPVLRFVRSQPHCTLIFDNLEAASVEVGEVIHQIIRSGQLEVAGNGPRVSLAHTLVFGVVNSNALNDIDVVSTELTLGEQRKLVTDRLDTLDVLPNGASEVYDQVFPLSPLNAIQNAEVIVQLMRAECRQYERVLERVSPEVLADLVSRLDPQIGLSEIPTQVSRTMRDPILRAVKRGEDRISIRMTSSASSCNDQNRSHASVPGAHLEVTKPCQR